MTSEQLDEIEKLADVEHGWGLSFGDLIACRNAINPLVKALREARAERDEALGDARLADCQLDEIVELVGSGGDGSAFGSVESLLCDLKERTEERDEARAEVEQLREIVKTAGDRLRACAHELTEHSYQEMADALFDLPASAEVAP